MQRSGIREFGVEKFSDRRMYSFFEKLFQLVFMAIFLICMVKEKSALRKIFLKKKNQI